MLITGEGSTPYKLQHNSAKTTDGEKCFVDLEKVLEIEKALGRLSSTFEAIAEEGVDIRSILEYKPKKDVYGYTYSYTMWEALLIKDMGKLVYQFCNKPTLQVQTMQPMPVEQHMYIPSRIEQQFGHEVIKAGGGWTCISDTLHLANASDQMALEIHCDGMPLIRHDTLCGPDEEIIELVTITNTREGTEKVKDQNGFIVVINATTGIAAIKTFTGEALIELI